MIKRKTRPNVLCLISDDTDPFNLGCYGGDAFMTPRLDALAGEGMRFTRAHAVCPVCTPSRYAYLTGQYPSRCPNGFRQSNPTDDVCNITWNTDLAPGQANLATVFRDNGYRTGYVGKFHCGRSMPAIGMEKVHERSHFDPDLRHDPYDPEKDAILRHNQRCMVEELGRYGWSDARHVTWGNLDGNAYLDVPHNLEWTTRGVLELLEAYAGGGEPFLLYVGYHPIHGPKHGEDLDKLDERVTPGGLLDEPDPAGHPPRASVLKRLREAGLDPYHRNVGALWMDDSVGVILDRLEELGLAEDTIVIYKADHGKFGKATVYNDGSNVPMIWRWPGEVDPGSVCYNIVQNIDFLPTLVEALGLEMPSGYACDGDSYLAHLRGSTEPLREDFYNEMGVGRSVQTERWKYVALRYPRETLERLRGGDFAFPPDHLCRGLSAGNPLALYHSAYYEAEQLYEIEQDRGETMNLAGHPAYAEVLAEMKGRLRKYIELLPHPFPEAPDPVQTSDAFRAAIQRARELSPGAVEEKSVFGMRFW